ncbi:hypothetical protein DPMN_108590 [Dreissena polymorpha]|uniref:Uncharacterized protein n=1 Tax=Dreissena polymorpha TaxID=45954 RepID=A0A9D4K9E9_DREPO|nr:hypothetical protein DPMN_108590 [Dreissena polymorpha]
MRERQKKNQEIQQTSQKGDVSVVRTISDRLSDAKVQLMFNLGIVATAADVRYGSRKGLLTEAKKSCFLFSAMFSQK